MGQPLPLPDRIPRPDTQLTEKMKEIGFTISDDENERYVRYTMPSGWRLENHSWREDLPEYYFVDEKNIAMISVNGCWKGSYDNKLSIQMIKQPFVYKPRESEMIPSETSPEKLFGKFAEALDPQHRQTNI